MDIVVPLLVAILVGVPIIFASTWKLRPQQRVFIVRVLLAAFALRVGLSLLFYAVPQARVYHEDADGTEYLALRLATYWLHEGPPLADWSIPERNYGIVYVFAGVCYALGRYRLTITVFNSLVGTLTVLLVFRIGLNLFHEVVARRSAQLVAFFPSMIVWSSIAIKDPLVSFFICLSVLSCVLLRRKFSVGSLAGTLLPIFAVYPIRFYLVYFMLMAVVGTIVISHRRRFAAGVSKQLLVIVGLAVIVGGLGLFSYASEDFTNYLDLERVSNYRQAMASTANSGFAADVNISTPGAAVMFLPVGLTTLLWGPFPWQMTSLRPLLTAPEMLFWWSLAPALLRGFLWTVRRRFRECSSILVFSVALLIGYSLILGNVGAAFRMRAQILNLLFLFCAVGSYLPIARRRGLDVNLLFTPAIS